ncbi:hypothetical protein NliqN6_5295 [Naganishia liquefaciens]|uniref:Uncharacterized protein n=1 Tax=Naganishia liquefaciens TaxID=104408 RepID=A0A8H3TXZ0_9TREE|nr:hypothetical protein NliqN6_5295 [Naganishia liquefaciens]
MLLRLVPTPTEANPQPPTILFTLPIPNQPYSAKGLPLPSQLLAHRSICLQQGIECSNILLGDKASWLFGVITEVTFITYAKQINIQMHDGSERWLELTSACMAQCDKVIEQVNLSFVPVPKDGTVSPMSPPMSPRPKASGSSFLETRRSSPSSLLMSLLSPLISSSSPSSTDVSAGSFAMQQARASHQGRPTSTMAMQRAVNPAKFHRRLARSMLVDTFRQFVLPCLKASLPSTYLYLTIESDLAKKREEWNTLQTEIEALLERAEYQRTATVATVLRRPSLGSRHNASSNFRRALANVPESSATAPTSRRSMSASSSASTVKADSITSLAPALYIATLPDYSELPATFRVPYATMHRRINDLSSHLASLVRLGDDLRSDQDQREEAEARELAKIEQKGIRRACSNGTIAPIHQHLRPTTPSSLRNCVFSEAESTTAVKLTKSTLPVEQDDEFAAGIQVRPISPALRQCSSFESPDDSDDSDDEELMRQHLASAFADFCISAPPALVYNRSVESLESEDGSPLPTPPLREDNEDDQIMYICPKTPRPASISQLPAAIFADSPSALCRLSLDSVEPLKLQSVQDEDNTDDVRHDEFLVDVVSGRRKSEGMPFPWTQQQARASVC